ncbi:MAG: 50S ribosomal protein L22 [Candidatus Magasanikbacteria bacterium RIFOXYA1_FULL_40_8]|uniref:Large ribosomal subunit protein uL22 n=1 Tax=Candidatus Magasanikbacteria bacterium RIFOXYA1_FULL_40_8 TaxID=1798694 RepID=A0A1F6NTQ1_9BACT|nr:MAG: 50S ribosomal protein L22 [Candidatus Magasanikbacteria bacterium RIFOXYA1_FULL_40_8]
MDKLQTKATIKGLRVAPRKVRLLIDLIRGMQVDRAIEQLEISKKDAAREVLKLLKSAIANARHNHQLKTETLVIKIAFVDGGATLHRWTPRAMGRATPIRKRTAHVTLILEGEVDEKAVKKVSTKGGSAFGGKVGKELVKKEKKEIEEIKGENTDVKTSTTKKAKNKK